MARGFTRSETLLLFLVVLLAGAIIGSFAWIGSRQNVQESEAERMRKVYVALSMYEPVFDGRPAPDLHAIRDLVLPIDLVSERDPYAKVNGSLFPNDPGIPTGQRQSAHRISFAYLWAHQKAKRIKVPNWSATRLDPKIGLLASEWTGEVKPQKNFQAQVTGPVIRLNTDGALYVLPDRGGPKPLGDAQDLFIRRSK